MKISRVLTFMKYFDYILFKEQGELAFMDFSHITIP